MELSGNPGGRLSVAAFHNAFELLDIGATYIAPPSQPIEENHVSELTFGVERDLQQALRANISQLEEGLTVADDGSERTTEAGRIDITARDAAGRTVLIELKAGTALPEALTQLLDNMASVSSEEGRPARGLLIAGDFHPRLVRASTLVSDIKLLKYRFTFSFEVAK